MNLFHRREFLQIAGTVAASTDQGLGSRPPDVSLVIEAKDSVASASPAQWAANEVISALAARGVSAHVRADLSGADPGDFIIYCSGPTSALAREALKNAGATAPSAPESLVLTSTKAGGRSLLLATGADTRGLVYALLELADRIQLGSDITAALEVSRPIAEQPANTIRSVTRLFCSEVEDKAWFNDREMWPKYLTMLATQRFNRFNLALGIGYDFLRNVTDAYFLFAYPFLLSPPGYNVRVPQLPADERDRNLATLRYISEQTAARGMQFQLGIWMHGYEWIDSPSPNYTIEGLSANNHGPYCRDAVRALLQALPAVSGVTFRIHGESGVNEGSYEFWKTAFEGVRTCGRKVEIDMHSKGMDQTMLDIGVATGLPLKISTKYWAEHFGMPYHQADIRPVEYPREDRGAGALMRFSAGLRNFTRYGYADLLREDRRWGVLHRIWPGTQRLLLWGDPVTAAAHSQAFSFCGTDGVEIMEPLAFKGRRGSGLPGDRGAYADPSLRCRWDWEKYVYGHRVWGRLLYNPKTTTDVWQRYLQHQFGEGAPAAEVALANASRILPILTTAHGASAGNNTYWPEVYTNQPIIDDGQPHPYTDTPAPKVFGNVSPLDPQLFYRINDFADDLLQGRRSGKYTPIEVAQWLEDCAKIASNAQAEFEAKASKKGPESRRLSIDVALQAGLGTFFGAKLRSGVLYRIYEQTRNRRALDEALNQYRTARSAWLKLANRAKGVYVADITVGERKHLRGHWLDRVPAIDSDIAAMEKKMSEATDNQADEAVAKAIAEALSKPRRSQVALRHNPPQRFSPGQPLEIEAILEQRQSTVRLYYRHVTHAERYEMIEMQGRNNRLNATIPGTYTDSPYPLQYYFEIQTGTVAAVLHPSFGTNLTNQPYFVVRRKV